VTAEAVTSCCSEVLRLRSGVSLAVDRSGQAYLVHRSASQKLGALTAFQRDILRRLAESDCASDSMRAAARGGAGASGVEELDRLLFQLREGGWLHVTVVRDDRPAYTIEPYRRPAKPRPDCPSGALALSRFVVMRRSGTDLLIESPLAWCVVRVHDPDVVAELAAFIAPRAGTKAVPPPAPLAARLLSDLTWAAMVVEAPGSEDTSFEMRQWGPHELWFHKRSRREGVPDGHFGRTLWAAGEFEPLPARRPPLAGQVVELIRPDLDALRGTDATLTQVLEERRSIRRHDDRNPITLDQLGEFLFRAAGVRRAVGYGGVEHVTGPNPSGGALDPLEIYLAVRLASGLQPGLYRYDRFGHRLEHVCGLTRAVQRLVEAARNATAGLPEVPETYPPQIVVLLAARFGRVGWSYETLTYSLILKLVGVVFQTMYCVATAMGLAACAIGSGDSAVFAEATGLDALTEGTVGEFILGSRPVAPPGGPDLQVET
jgi:SagB-type dehydrogenase family enzyme